MAHGTSLRGIVKYIEKLSGDEITKIDLPNGIPIVYRYVAYICCNDTENVLQFRFDKKMEILISKEYLADAKTVEEAVQKVSNIVSQ